MFVFMSHTMPCHPKSSFHVLILDMFVIFSLFFGTPLAFVSQNLSQKWNLANLRKIGISKSVLATLSKLMHRCFSLFLFND